MFKYTDPGMLIRIYFSGRYDLDTGRYIVIEMF